MQTIPVPTSLAEECPASPHCSEVREVWDEKGHRAWHRQEYATAADVMEEILKICDVCPTFQFQYATCLLSMDRIDEAQARLERLSALKPDDPDIVYLRAEIVKQRNGIGEALPLFKEYARLDPSSSSLAMYIQAANDAGQTEEAARLALELLDRCPYDPTAVRIGLSELDQMGNPEAVAQTAAELGPDPSFEAELRVLTSEG